MKSTHAINKLMAMPLFTASEARKHGISPSLINHYIKSHVFERIGRGVYRGIHSEIDVDFQWEDLVLTAKSVPNGVICLISALAIYGLTDEIPRSFWIAVPHSSSSPKRKGAKFIRMRDMDTGAVTLQMKGEVIRIFDLERTLVDSFRCLSKEIAIKALKEALKPSRSNRLDLIKLQQYAGAFNINLDHYIMTITT